MDNLKFDTTFTTFDHVHLTTTFGQLRPKVEPSMKDHILGSDEYLIQAQDIILHHLERYGTGPLNREAETPLNEREGDNEENETVSHIDDNLAVHNIHSGRTSLHVFNRIIRNLQGLHNNISREKNAAQRNEVRRVSQQLFQLKQTLKKTRLEAEKQPINDQILDIQRQLGNDIEAKDKAAQMRISNFYRTRIGKMVPETFHCAKEKKPPRKILTLEHEGRTITQQEEIIQVMQQFWYCQGHGRYSNASYKHIF